MAQGVPGRLRPQIFLTFRHYKGGRSSSKRSGRLYRSRNPWYSLSEAESTSGHMVLSGVPWKKSPVTPPGIDPGTVRLVLQCLNHYTTPNELSSNNTKRSEKLCIRCNPDLLPLNLYIIPLRQILTLCSCPSFAI